VPGTVRIRIVRHRPGADVEDTIGVTSSIHEAGQIVERWLTEFVDSADRNAARGSGSPTGR
jgi:hypothetical protein